MKTKKKSGAIYIDERPPLYQCFFMGIQHVLAMFGSTVLGKFHKSIGRQTLHAHQTLLL